jgi:hypothetical protein
MIPKQLQKILNDRWAGNIKGHVQDWRANAKLRAKIVRAASAGKLRLEWFTCGSGRASGVEIIVQQDEDEVETMSDHRKLLDSFLDGRERSDLFMEGLGNVMSVPGSLKLYKLGVYNMALLLRDGITYGLCALHELGYSAWLMEELQKAVESKSKNATPVVVNELLCILEFLQNYV